MSKDLCDQSIIIVIPYFGHWPTWIDYFFKSCAFNPTVNWIFYTDCNVPESLPENVSVRSVGFQEYCRIVEDKLDISFSPDSPYKLCDLKPALGYVHEDDIEGYDLWGFGDLDVIYGDIRGYFTEKMMASNLISFHGHRISGHLCLMKNTKEMREAFQQYDCWQDVLSDPQHRCFDEKHFNSLFIRHKNWPKWLRDIIYYPRYFMRTAFFSESHSTNNTNVPWIDGSLNFPVNWYWNKGVLTSDLSGQRSFPYLHFLHWKSDWKQEMEADPDSDIWTINENGIFSQLISDKEVL